MSRSKERIKRTGEVFTPEELVLKLLDQIPEEKFQEPKSTFLDNSAGNGNFLVPLKERLCQYHPEKHVLDNMIFAVEKEPDNHAELCARLGVPTDHPHFICADALEYEYDFGSKPDKWLNHDLTDFFV